MKLRSEALESIPGIGPKIAQHLRLIGVQRVSDLKDSSPERLFSLLEQTLGAHVDRCVLYVFRSAVYFASHRKHDREKLKWWNWQDQRQRTITRLPPVSGGNTHASKRQGDT